MTTLNAYATLDEFKHYATDRGGEISAATADDTVIERILRAASRYMDSKTGRQFTPFVETRYFDVPTGDEIDPRTLNMDEDLLEVISLKNGDGITITSTDYNLRPKNSSPASGIRLKDNSSYTWASDSYGDIHDVIEVTGIWGFHNHYSKAWLLATTAAEAMDVSETGFDVTDGSGFVTGDIIRFDNEIGYVASVASNTLTITRGENLSTAATHLTAINVYIWQPMDEVKNAVLEIANTAYKRRFGQSLTSSETISPAGIVLSPLDIPIMAHDFIATYRRYV
jgi:hypothetical protein